MNINQTNDYSIFKTIQGNRVLNRSNLLRLEKSILEKNLLEYNPIIVNDSFEVIDGQHRLEVAKNNKLSIFYVVLSGGGLDSVQLFNANQQAWVKANYLDSYIRLGIQDYVILRDFMKQFGLPLTTATQLLSSVGDRDELQHRFKRGEFRVDSLRAGVNFAEQLNELKEYTEKNVWRLDNFVNALRTAYKKTNHTTFIHKLQVHNKKIRREGSIVNYLRQFEDIVNFRSGANSRVRLYEGKA